MDQLIEQLCAKTGIDRATADKVAQFIKNHAHEIPQWISQAKSGEGGNVMDQAKGLLGGFMGGDDKK